MSNAVELRSLSKSFERVKALDDVSFDVAEGELFGALRLAHTSRSRATRTSSFQIKVRRRCAASTW